MQNQNKNASVSPFTRVRVSIVKRDNLRALATVVVGEAMMITGIRVVEGKNGLFLAMPSRKTRSGEYEDVAFPMNSERREELSALVLGEYQEVLKKSQAAE